MRAFLRLADPTLAVAKAMASGADALLIEPGAAGLLHAAELVKHARPRPSRPALFVTCPDLDRSGIEADLGALALAGVDGLFLPRADDGASVQRLSARLAVAEAEAGLTDGAIKIVAMIGTARAIFALHSFAGCSRRLLGLFFDGEALARETALASDAAPLDLARSLTALAAAAAGVAAIVAPSPQSADAAFLAACEAARRDGFRAVVARSPGEIALVKRVFAGAEPSGG